MPGYDDAEGIARASGSWDFAPGEWLPANGGGAWSDDDAWPSDADAPADDGWPPVAADQGEAPAAKSWGRTDLSAVLDGTYEIPQPTVGQRDDGKGLFYPGRMHLVAAEAEAGKTWFALSAVATELARGNSALYLDFEDDAGGIVGRLLTMGVNRDAIRDRFAYIRPEEPIINQGNKSALIEVLADLRPTLAVIDGVTEAMSMHGLELKDNKDVALFGRMIQRPIAESGAATVALDHVVKDREQQRGGYAIGGVHKLNGLNGAMYLLENKTAFGIGRTGESRLFVRKDRPGQLRRNALSRGEGRFLYATMCVESHDESFAEWSLKPPEELSDQPFRPTAVMGKVSRALVAAPGGLSGKSVETAVTGKNDVIRLALEMLVSEGYAVKEKQGAAYIHKSVKPFTEAA